MGREVKICIHCEEELKGCPCAWRKTSGGKLVHQKCIKDYEAAQGHTLPTCAHCGVPFKEPAYFKAVDGRDVHYRCRRVYNKELLLKNKK